MVKARALPGYFFSAAFSPRTTWPSGRLPESLIIIDVADWGGEPGD